MKKNLFKEIKTTLDNNSNVDDELSKSIIVQVDSGLLDSQAKISNNLIELGYNDIYSMLTDALNEALKYVNKVNYNKPFKKSLSGKFMGIPLDMDITSKTTSLYTALFHMTALVPFFDPLFKKLDEIESDFQNMVSSNNLSNATAFNKTAMLAQMEGIKNLRLSLTTLYNCYCEVLKNPQVKDFFIKWLEFKRKTYKKVDYEHDYEVVAMNEKLISRINRM